MATKEIVLKILMENQNKSVSGELLAEKCQVSRAAVWKAVKSLREKGYAIEGTTNGGYILSGNDDVLDENNFKNYLYAAYPELKESENLHVECFKEIDSTNTYAKKCLTECGNLRDMNGKLTLAGQKYNNAVFVAESQTAGRGRLGRTFYSPKDTGIYFSLVYCPENGISEPAKITAFSAVAVCRVLSRLYKVSPKIKWINDVFVNGKKVCGILTEGFTDFETGRIESAIIGIGINIADNKDCFPEEVLKIAGSVLGNTAASHAENSEKDTGNPSENNTENAAETIPSPTVNYSRCQLAAEVSGEVIKILTENPQDVLREYKEYLFLTGMNVRVHPVIGNESTDYEAKVIGIDDEVRLIVEDLAGNTKALSSGEVSLHSFSD
jgi:BirA family biotin operon repressor/biotin-[acetyl-CoA-carboxylase] ligase